MIDEAVLAEMLTQAADEIPIPADGPERVVHALAVSSEPRRRPRPNLTKPLMAAAAIVIVALVAVPMLNERPRSKTVAVTAPAQSSVTTPVSGLNGRAPSGQLHGGSVTPTSGAGSYVSGTAKRLAPATGYATADQVDAAKIVKTGTLDLQVPRASLRTAVNRVTGAAVGLGGYVANSKTNYGGANPTAQITVRVPADEFEAAIARLDALPGVKLLGGSENGTDVSAQYADLQAQLAAATSGRDALLVVLSQAETIGDILAVQDRVTAAQTQVEQLQGRINVLSDQAAFSSLAVTLSEKPARAPGAVANPANSEGGLAEAWSDARQGFSNGIEWLIARSGGALIVLLAGLALLFGLRYLYPIVRRGLV